MKNKITTQSKANRTAKAHWRKLPLGLAVAALAVPAPMAFAQAGMLEEIVVSARKREESLQDTPIAVTAFTSAGIQARGIEDIAGVGEFTPNMEFDFTAPNTGSSSAANIFIRGIGQTETLMTQDPGVGIYLDGVYIARSIGAVLDVMDVERIEVLRGPQGTLFGRNTLAGAINVTSKSPEMDLFSGELQLEYGTDNLTKGRAIINAPLVDDTLALRVAVMSAAQDGYGDRVLTGEEMGDEETNAMRAVLRWLPSDALTVDWAFDYSESDEESPNEVLLNVTTGPAYPNALTTAYNGINFGVFGGALPPYDSRYITDDKDSSLGTGFFGSYTEIWGTSVDVRWDIAENMELRSITAYRDMEAQYGRDSDHSPITLVEAQNTDEHDQFSQEFNLSGTAFDNKLDWLGGVYYFQEDGTSVEEVLLVPDLVPILDISKSGPLNIDNTSIAIFTQNTWHFDERWSATVGARYTEEEKEVETLSRFTGSGDLLVANPKADEDFENWTGRAGVEFQQTADMMWYASVAKGFKSGGFSGRYVTFPGVPIPEPSSYEPEEVLSYEVGMKSEWWERRLRLNLAAFYTEYDDIQIVVFQGPAPQTRNVAEGEINGFEAELTVAPIDALNLYANVGYTDADYTDIGVIPGIAVPIEENYMFVNTPEWSGALGGEYTIRIGDMGDLALRADYSYRSEVANDAINTPELIEDELDLLNVRATFMHASGDWDLALYGKNVTDEVYLVSGNADLINTGFSVGNYSRGEEWGAEFTYRF